MRRIFEELHRTVSIDPHEKWNLSRDDGSFTPRVIDLVAPLGKGQRCLIVAPPKAGKTTLLLEVCRSLEVNHPDAKVFALLVDERPEEVTHFRRSCHADVIAASSDQVAREHVKTTEAAIQRVLQPVLAGEDVVLLLDSITRLARAYNTVKGDSGRTLSGGLDANTMQIPRRLFGAARKIEHGGSLTILGTALVDTGSRMDEVIFQEFKGTGNTEIVLSRQLFEKRIFPAVDIAKSGTRKEEKLYSPDVIERIQKIRRVMASMTPDRAMDGLLKLMAKHPTNEELLNALPVA
jgi:transcription termination factor Rho